MESATTIDKRFSAIIEAAGTAHESVLSLWASSGDFEIISTLFSGFTNVGIGFMDSLIDIGYALLIPPSIPPALFDFL